MILLVMKEKEGKHEPNKLTCSPLCDFIAQWLEHCTGIAEVMGSNPVESPEFFQVHETIA